MQDTRRCGFTVLFRGPGVAGGGAVTAVVGHSNSALRAVLREERVPFAMPLAPRVREDPAAAAALADVEACNAGKVRGRAFPPLEPIRPFWLSPSASVIPAMQMYILMTFT